MKLIKRLFTCALAVCVLCVAALSAYAADVMPDLTRTGSLSVTMEKAPGSSLSVYQVAGIEEAGGSVKYVFTSAFAGSGASLDDLESDKLAAELNSYAQEHKLEGQQMTIGKDGTGKLENLTLGVYLVAQKDTVEGQKAINPFLVTIPLHQDGVLAYDVDASPKVGTKPVTPPGTNPPGRTPPGSNPPGSNPPSRLPQTGQLWWPVPVLAGAGALFFVIGLVRRRND